jgi:hypothetical protein
MKVSMRNEEPHQAWRTALSIVGDRPVIVDITFIVEAGERGRALWRLRELVLRHSAVAAVIPAQAEKPRALSALARHKSDAFNAVSDRRRMECRVP